MRFSAILSDLERDVFGSRKSALRLCLWFAFGYSESIRVSRSNADDFLDDVRAYVLENGGVKSEGSARVKTTRVVGQAFPEIVRHAGVSPERAAPQLISELFNSLSRSGIRSVDGLTKLALKLS